MPPIASPGIGSYEGGNNARKLVNAREEDYWTPRNYGHTTGGLYTLRRGLENSINIVTAHLLDGGIEADPEKSLDDICATAVAAKIYADCVRYYPFVLGAQPVRMIDLAAFYAAVANEGARPQPHAINSIEVGGRTIYQYPNTPPPTIGAAADHTSFYQLATTFWSAAISSFLKVFVAIFSTETIVFGLAVVAGRAGFWPTACDEVADACGDSRHRHILSAAHVHRAPARLSAPIRHA